jgi:hypothetical protein
MGSSTAIAQDCVGDCNDDGFVRINELITAVNISLGNADLSACPSIDANDSGTAQINELIQAVNISLAGVCPTPSTTPTPVPPPAVCALSEDSTLTLATAAGATFLLFPTGDLEVMCEPTDGNDLSCTCDVRSFDTVELIGIGDVCVAPFSPCPARVADCDGNTGIDVTLLADHNIGACTGTSDCATQCDAHCDGLEGDYFRQASTCEDFCAGGEMDGAMCEVDADCPNGSCGGPEGGTDGAICECTCVEPGTGTGTVGGLSCGLGVGITVEFDSSGICGDLTPPTITLPPLCGELTTGTAVGSLLNAVNMPGVTVSLPSKTGEPASCQSILAPSPSVSGAALVGNLAFYGSNIGDIYVENYFVCE